MSQIFCSDCFVPLLYFVVVLLNTICELAVGTGVLKCRAGVLI